MTDTLATALHRDNTAPVRVDTPSWTGGGPTSRTGPGHGALPDPGAGGAELREHDGDTEGASAEGFRRSLRRGPGWTGQEVAGPVGSLPDPPLPRPLTPCPDPLAPPAPPLPRTRPESLGAVPSAVPGEALTSRGKGDQRSRHGVSRKDNAAATGAGQGGSRTRRMRGTCQTVARPVRGLPTPLAPRSDPLAPPPLRSRRIGALRSAWRDPDLQGQGGSEIGARGCRERTPPPRPARGTGVEDPTGGTAPARRWRDQCRVCPTPLAPTPDPLAPRS